MRVTAQGEYPPNWDEIRKAAYARAGWRCEHCGMEFPEGDTRAKTARNLDGKPTILTIHHLDGDRGNNSWRNLLSCCQRCHLHIQAVWKPGDPLPPAWGGVAPLWLEIRELPYAEMKQLSFDDFESMRDFDWAVWQRVLQKRPPTFHVVWAKDFSDPDAEPRVLYTSLDPPDDDDDS